MEPKPEEENGRRLRGKVEDFLFALFSPPPVFEPPTLLLQPSLLLKKNTFPWASEKVVWGEGGLDTLCQNTK